MKFVPGECVCVSDWQVEDGNFWSRYKDVFRVT